MVNCFEDYFYGNKAFCHLILLLSQSFYYRYKKTDGTGQDFERPNLRVTNYKVENLQSNAEYVFELAAVNGEGDGPKTEITYTPTPPSTHSECLP